MTTPSDQDLRRMLADGVVIHIGGHYYLVAKAIGWDPQSGQPIKWAPYREVDAQDAIAELNRLAALSGEIARLKGEVAAAKRDAEEAKMRANRAAADVRNDLLPKLAKERERYDTLHDQRHAEARKADEAWVDAARWKERAERAEAGRQEAQERLNNSRDWHQQRYNRLRKWVDEEVKPLSEEVHRRYYAIVANGAASPAESADWSGTLHSMGLQLDAARADADRLAGLLGEVVEAYAGRFEVPGRGLVGPIDPEIEQARSALAGRGGRKEGGG